MVALGSIGRDTLLSLTQPPDPTTRPVRILCKEWLIDDIP